MKSSLLMCNTNVGVHYLRDDRKMHLSDMANRVFMVGKNEFLHDRFRKMPLKVAMRNQKHCKELTNQR